MKRMRNRYYIALISSIFLGSCQNSSSVGTTNSDSLEAQIVIDSVWTQELMQEVLEGCMGNRPIKGMSKQENEVYCQCILDKIMKKYPNPPNGEEYFPNDFVISSSSECLEYMEKLGQADKTGINRDEQLLTRVMIILRKAIVLEPMIKDESDKNEFLSLLSISINLSKQISDEFLDSVHPEMKAMFRDNMIQGARLKHEGYNIKDNPVQALKSINQGTVLWNKYAEWWNINRTNIKSN